MLADILTARSHCRDQGWLFLEVLSADFCTVDTRGLKVWSVMRAKLHMHVCALPTAACVQGAADRGGLSTAKGSSHSPGRPLNISGDGGVSGRSGGGSQQASREAAGTSSLLGGTRVSC